MNGLHDTKSLVRSKLHDHPSWQGIGILVLVLLACGSGSFKLLWGRQTALALGQQKNTEQFHSLDKTLGEIKGEMLEIKAEIRHVRELLARINGRPLSPPWRP